MEPFQADRHQLNIQRLLSRQLYHKKARASTLIFHQRFPLDSQYLEH
jgi:hypothetical protein